jgi:hypothetical protein
MKAQNQYPLPNKQPRRHDAKIAITTAIALMVNFAQASANSWIHHGVHPINTRITALVCRADSEN